MNLLNVMCGNKLYDKSKEGQAHRFSHHLVALGRQPDMSQNGCLGGLEPLEESFGDMSMAQRLGLFLQKPHC